MSGPVSWPSWPVASTRVDDDKEEKWVRIPSEGRCVQVYDWAVRLPDARGGSGAREMLWE